MSSKISKDVLEKYGIQSKTGRSVTADKLPNRKEQKETRMSSNTKKEKNPNHLYIGKVKEIEGKYGTFESIMIDNTDINSEYHKYEILLKDKESGRVFQVKQIQVAGVAEGSKKYGFTKSLRVDISNDYAVEERF